MDCEAERANDRRRSSIGFPGFKRRLGRTATDLFVVPCNVLAARTRVGNIQIEA